MRFTGGRSGFKSARDLGLFALGCFIDLYHLVNTPPDKLSVGILLVGAAVAGSPSVLRSDERYDDDKDEYEERVERRKRPISNVDIERDDEE